MLRTPPAEQWVYTPLRPLSSVAPLPLSSLILRSTIVFAITAAARGANAALAATAASAAGDAS